MVQQRRSRFEEIYRSQIRSGQGVVSAFGSTIRERAKERADLRRLLPTTGMLGAVMEATFGKAYKSNTRRNRTSTMSSSASPLDDKVLNVIRINTTIFAKNSMVLPGMARDMNIMRQNIVKMTKKTVGTAATRADAFFLRSRERETSYEATINRDSNNNNNSNTSRTTGGSGGIFKSLFGGIGSILGGTLAIGGSIISSIVSGLGSVLGIVGGVAGGILGTIGSAVAGLGIMGIIALAGAGYMISQMSKSGMFDDMSIGSMFGLAPRTDGKGLFEGTAKKLDDFFKTDEFTKTLHQIKGTFAGLASATLKVFSNLSQIMSNFLNLAIQELKIIFTDLSNKTLAIIGGAFGAKAGLGLAAVSGNPLGAAISLASFGALGYFGGKKIAENIEESLASGDITKSQRDVIQSLNAKGEQKQGYIDSFIKLKRLQEAGINSKVEMSLPNDFGESGKYNSVDDAMTQLMESVKLNEKDLDLKKIEKDFKTAFGVSIATDDSFNMLAMKFKRDNLLKNVRGQKSIFDGAESAFDETKAQYIQPTTRSDKGTMPTKANQSDMANLIRKRFIEAGFTPEQAQAAVINAFAESTLDPKAQSEIGPKEDSVGLFQMNKRGGLGTNYTTEQLKDPNFNIDLAIKAAKKSKAFSRAGTLDEAIEAFMNDVENPANKQEQLAKRLALSNGTLETAINENTDALIVMNKQNEENKDNVFFELLTAIISGIEESTTSTNVTNVNNTSVSGGNSIASPYNEDMFSLYKTRTTQGF